MAPRNPSGQEKPKKPKIKVVKSKKKAESARMARLTIQRRTLILMLVFGVAAFAALFAQVYRLTITQHEELQDRASRQQTMSTTISASRGSIYDRNGELLAISSSADTIFLDPKVIQERADELDLARAEKLVNGLKEGETLPITGAAYKDLIATTLAEILGMDPDDIYEKMEKTKSRYEVLSRRAERTVGDQIREFITNNPTGQDIQGIHLASDSKRYYPNSSLAAHAIGFLDYDNHGAYGLEALYEDDLDGTTGYMVTAKDANNHEMLFQYEQYYDAEDGHSLQLTIDRTIQYYVERGLADMLAKFDAEKGGAGIVLDANSGAILAIASSPTYDLNDPRAIIDGLLSQELESGEAEKGDLQLQQWRSKAVTDTYEPGSTYKILTLAAALEEGTVNLNSSFYCGGSIQVNDAVMHCSNRNGHGTQTLEEAAGHSCNPAFISMGLSLGVDTYWHYMEAFGLFGPTGVDLQGEATGVHASLKRMTTTDLAAYAFGQNFTVTPLQLIAAQAACINGGYLYTPHIVDKVLDADGNVVKQYDATPVRQVVSEETSATVRQVLEYVVANGTGKNGQVAGYRIGGKTGTADQRNAAGQTEDIVVSFLCFAPADDPQIIMLLTMDTPSRTTGTYPSGGNMVAPTSAAIMADILPYLGIAPQYDESNASAAEAAVPYVVDSSIDDAVAKLNDYGFQSYRTVGDGDTVTDQTPAGGAIVPVGAEIVLYMGAEKSAEPSVVPNVVGLSAKEANKQLTNAGLIMRATGASEGSGVKVISQSRTEGEEVAAGTVVTVQMGQLGGTSD